MKYGEVYASAKLRPACGIRVYQHWKSLNSKGKELEYHTPQPPLPKKPYQNPLLILKVAKLLWLVGLCSVSFVM